MAFRIPPKDVGFFKQMAEEQYKRGDLRAPTIAALCKQNLYWNLKIDKELEKARIRADQEPRGLYNNPSEESRGQTNVNDYQRYYKPSYPSSPQVSSIPAAEIAQQNQIEENQENDDGRVLKEPYFYEFFPDWKQRLKRLRGQEER